MKFFTKLCFIFLFVFSGNIQGQILLQDTTKNKNYEITFGQKIYYKLYSDSVLGVEISKDYGTLLSSTDSSLILDDSYEVLIADLKYLEIENDKIEKWRGISSPFLIAGIGLLSKGASMLLLEGSESKNKELIPIYTSSGLIITSFASIPFWKKNKSFDLTTKNFQIITP